MFWCVALWRGSTLRFIEHTNNCHLEPNHDARAFSVFTHRFEPSGHPGNLCTVNTFGKRVSYLNVSMSIMDQHINPVCRPVHQVNTSTLRHMSLYRSAATRWHWQQIDIETCVSVPQMSVIILYMLTRTYCGQSAGASRCELRLSMQTSLIIQKFTKTQLIHCCQGNQFHRQLVARFSTRLPGLVLNFFPNHFQPLPGAADCAPQTTARKHGFSTRVPNTPLVPK